MKFSRLIIAAALAFGLGGAASAMPLAPSAAEMIQQPGTSVAFTKWKGHKGWKGNRGRHYGWNRGRHRGWYKPRRHRVYYAPPRRHYGYYRGNHYGWRHARPRRGVHIRF